MGHSVFDTVASEGTPPEARGSAVCCLLDGLVELALEGNRIEDLAVVSGADGVIQCPDSQFPDIEEHDRIGETLDDVFRERTAAYTGRGREPFEKAAREGIGFSRCCSRLSLSQIHPATPTPGRGFG